MKAVLAGGMTVGPLAGAALASPPIPDWLKPMPDVIEVCFAKGTAQDIAGSCRSQFIPDPDRIRKVMAVIDTAYKTAGLGGIEAASKALVLEQGEARVHERSQALIKADDKKRHIDPNDAATWCAAGQAEGTEGSLISQFLHPKKRQ